MRSPAANDPISEAEAAGLFAGSTLFRCLRLQSPAGRISTASDVASARWAMVLRENQSCSPSRSIMACGRDRRAKALAVKRLAEQLMVEHRTHCAGPVRSRKPAFRSRA